MVRRLFRVGSGPGRFSGKLRSVAPSLFGVTHTGNADTATETHYDRYDETNRYY